MQGLFGGGEMTLFIFQRESTCRGRGRGGESPAVSRHRSHDPEIVTWAENKLDTQQTEPPRHPMSIKFYVIT